MKNSFVAIENIDDQPAPFQIIKEKNIPGPLWRDSMAAMIRSQFTRHNPIYSSKPLRGNHFVIIKAMA